MKAITEMLYILGIVFVLMFYLMFIAPVYAGILVVGFLLRKVGRDFLIIVGLAILLFLCFVFIMATQDTMVVVEMGNL